MAPNWLSCFPFTAQKLVYDVFFVKGLTIEVVQTMIPSLDCNGCDVHDANAIRSNAERLLLILVSHMHFVSLILLSNYIFPKIFV